MENLQYNMTYATISVLFCLAGLFFALLSSPFWVTFQSLGLMFSMFSVIPKIDVTLKNRNRNSRNREVIKCQEK